MTLYLCNLKGPPGSTSKLICKILLRRRVSIIIIIIIIVTDLISRQEATLQRQGLLACNSFRTSITYISVRRSPGTAVYGFKLLAKLDTKPSHLSERKLDFRSGSKQKYCRI